MLTSFRTNKIFKREEEKASKKLMAKIAKTCPGCKRPIEKSYGCDHMTCELSSDRCVLFADLARSGTKCRHEFCWQCLAPYKKRTDRDYQGVAHNTGCLYFDDNGGNRPAMWEEGFLFDQ